MKYIKLTLIFSFLIVLSNCDGLLDVQPKQSIDEDIALSTPDNVKKTLVGAYNRLGANSFYGGFAYLVPDMMTLGSEAIFTGTQTQGVEAFNKTFAVSGTFGRDLWMRGYETINIVNNVLSALDILEGSEKTRVEGEAKFLRGIAYFQLVRLFAKDYDDGDPSTNLGVPITLEPTRNTGEGLRISRNTVQEVYDQVISDLTDAKTMLGEQSPGYIYANTYAASAFLSRVYMQQKEYGPARDEATRVIDDGFYSLTSAYADAFNHSNSNTSEDIFAVQKNSQSGSSSLNDSYNSLEEGGSRQYSMSIAQKHLDRYEPGDDRLNLFYLAQDGEYRTGKWHIKFGNVNVMRLAEMYLNRAEANIRLNETEGDTPENDLFRIRDRVNLGLIPNPSLQDVLDERYLELAFEGHFLFDLKRLQGTVDGFSWDSPRLVIPIPQREMEANPALKGQQNEGYGG